MNSMLVPGQPAPWSTAKALSGNPTYAFHSAAGRWIVMLFLGSGTYPKPEEALNIVLAHQDLFDDDKACFFGVTIDPNDVKQGRIKQRLPGVRWFLDYDRAISIAYGAAHVDGTAVTYTPHWLLLDPMLRVRKRATIADGPEIMAELRIRTVSAPTGTVAPLLIVPDILPPKTFRELIELYDREGVESLALHESLGRRRSRPRFAAGRADRHPKRKG